MNTQERGLGAATLIATFIIFVSTLCAANQIENADRTASADVKQKTRETIGALENYSIQQRDKAVKEVKSAMEDLDARTERLQKRIDQKWDNLDQTTRDKIKNTLKTLRKKRNELSEWYGGLKHSSDNAWNHVKKGFVDGYESLTKGYDKAERELE